MHFHLPKPMHGWREFLGEVGIIVIGVLIALAFEAFVEELQWQRKVTQARADLRHEVGHNIALLNDRIAERACVDRRLDELGLILNQASASGKLPPVGSIGKVAYNSWPESDWNSEIAAQTATHFPPQQVAALGRVYAIIAFTRGLNGQEHDAWLTLEGIVGPGRSVAPATIDRLIDALTIAREINRDFPSLHDLMARILSKGDLGLQFPQTDPENPPVLDDRTSICSPISVISPKSYGSG